VFGYCIVVSFTALVLFVIKHFTKYTLCFHTHTHLTTLSQLLAVGGVTCTVIIVSHNHILYHKTDISQMERINTASYCSSMLTVHNSPTGSTDSSVSDQLHLYSLNVSRKHLLRPRGQDTRERGQCFMRPITRLRPKPMRPRQKPENLACSITILVFPYQTGWQYSDGGAECKGV